MERFINDPGQIREMLNDRNDSIKSGRVKLIDGEEAFARLLAKTEEQRKRQDAAAIVERASSSS